MGYEKWRNRQPRRCIKVRSETSAGIVQGSQGVSASLVLVPEWRSSWICSNGGQAAECQYKRYKFYNTILGEGSFGIVSKYEDHYTGDIVAIKKIKIKNPLEGIPSSVVREVSLLRELDHENIIRLLDVLSSKESIDLVFEFMDGDLRDFMTTQPDAMNSCSIKKYLHQILCGLAYCHSHKILHRDLKPRNFLIHHSKDFVKIADFGLARPIDDSLDEYTASLATMRYMAPERLLGHGRYSTPVDVWSVACIFAEMVTRQPLFRARSAINQLFSIFKIMGTPKEETLPGYTSLCRDHLGFFPPKKTPKDLAKVVPGLEPTGIDLLQKMLCLDSRKRITAQEALKHEYFNDLQNAP
ncbi:hypothetical protein EZV62_019434 [Acer yangbiense]|uniref:cyclin-dependent kinase n=1 Tax=Acer yangbiense TaxID=1000413 RepID=A0A5C7HBB9_9ROSI|nr:hypothetical protein EZV62_019434 [Acer yangbiense]